MKYYIAHNTKLEFKDSWPTADKRGTVVIYDTNNLTAIAITFGKKPKIKAWRTKKNGDFTEELS